MYCVFGVQLLGHGNGYTFEATPFCSVASRDGVHVLFAGEVSKWPGVDVVSVAHDGGRMGGVGQGCATAVCVAS